MNALAMRRATFLTAAGAAAASGRPLAAQTLATMRVGRIVADAQAYWPERRG